MTLTDTTSKPFMIDKRRVYEAYKAVKSNKGGAGVDGADDRGVRSQPEG
jgi:RNA-directed DNA polymerase